MIKKNEEKTNDITLKGSSQFFFLSPKPHILDSNRVWYSLFLSEGPKNHLNLKILVSKLVPWDLEGCRTSDLEGRRRRTSKGDSFKVENDNATLMKVELFHL